MADLRLQRCMIIIDCGQFLVRYPRRVMSAPMGVIVMNKHAGQFNARLDIRHASPECFLAPIKLSHQLLPRSRTVYSASLHHSATPRSPACRECRVFSVSANRAMSSGLRSTTERAAKSEIYRYGTCSAIGLSSRKGLVDALGTWLSHVHEFLRGVE